MLDNDLAELYDVETKVLNQAVKRNSHRFPDDFMFQLSENYLKLGWQKNRARRPWLITSQQQNVKVTKSSNINGS